MLLQSHGHGEVVEDVSAMCVLFLNSKLRLLVAIKFVVTRLQA